MAPPDDYIRRDTQWAIGATLLGQKDFGFEANQNGSKDIFDSRTLFLHVGETYIFFSVFFLVGEACFYLEMSEILGRSAWKITDFPHLHPTATTGPKIPRKRPRSMFYWAIGILPFKDGNLTCWRWVTTPGILGANFFGCDAKKSSPRQNGGLGRISPNWCLNSGLGIIGICVGEWLIYSSTVNLGYFPTRMPARGKWWFRLGSLIYYIRIDCHPGGHWNLGLGEFGGYIQLHMYLESCFC